MRNKIEIYICNKIIKYIQSKYGANCTDYEEDCMGCQARKVILFIKNHTDIIKFFEEIK